MGLWSKHARSCGGRSKLGNRRPSRRTANRTPLAVQSLEDRRLLTGYVVDQLSFTSPDSFVAQASISDDGSRIAVVSTADLEGSGRNADGHLEIFLYDVDVAAFRQITDGLGISAGTKIDLSGDGNRIAFTSQDDLTGANSDGSQEVFVYDIAADNFLQVTDSAFLLKERVSISDDGLRVAYHIRNASFDFGTTYLADLSGPMPTSERVLIGGDSPVLSGDGSRIAMESTRDLGENPEFNREIFVFDAASHSIEQITHTVDGSSDLPSISRDGTHIAFRSTVDLDGANRWDDAEVYLYREETHTIESVLRGDNYGVRISSDGMHVASLLKAGGFGLVLRDLETSESIVLTIVGSLPEPEPVPPGQDPTPTLSNDEFMSRISISLGENASHTALTYFTDEVGTNPDGSFELYRRENLCHPSPMMINS